MKLYTYSKVGNTEVTEASQLAQTLKDYTKVLDYTVYKLLPHIKLNDVQTFKKVYTSVTFNQALSLVKRGVWQAFMVEANTYKENNRLVQTDYYMEGYKPTIQHSKYYVYREELSLV